MFMHKFLTFSVWLVLHAVCLIGFYLLSENWKYILNSCVFHIRLYSTFLQDYVYIEEGTVYKLTLFTIIYVCAGVIFVHDLSQRRTKTSLQKWASEIAATGTFSAPLANGGPGGLPVPYIVIGNKADIASKEGRRNSSGNLVDMARQWVEKQGLLPPSDELPLTDSFPGSGGLMAVRFASLH